MNNVLKENIEKVKSDVDKFSKLRVEIDDGFVGIVTYLREEADECARKAFIEICNARSLYGMWDSYLNKIESESDNWSRLYALDRICELLSVIEVILKSN